MKKWTYPIFVLQTIGLLFLHVDTSHGLQLFSKPQRYSSKYNQQNILSIKYIIRAVLMNLLVLCENYIQFTLTIGLENLVKSVHLFLDYKLECNSYHEFMIFFSKSHPPHRVLWSLRNFFITVFLKNFRENNLFSKDFTVKLSSRNNS